MKAKALSQSNPHLKQANKARRNRVRCLASSTAIETGESIQRIEKKISHIRSAQSRVKLA